MSTITVEINNEAEKILKIGAKGNISISELFAKFGIDYDMIVKEKKYQDEFLDDIDKGNFKISNEF